MVGFLPAVREELIRAGGPRERPPLVVCERPREIGPDGGRSSTIFACSFEVASEPPRLRQDEALFQKEIDRFQSALEPLPSWLLESPGNVRRRAVDQALSWARTLQLVKDEREGNQVRLQVTSKGEKWLAGGLDEQYARIYNFLMTHATIHDVYAQHQRFLFPGLDVYSHYEPGDVRFLGAQALVRKMAKGKPLPYYWNAKPEELPALRDSLDRALGELKPGVFYRLDSVASHLAFGDYNPLNLGVDPKEVAVYWMDRMVPPLEEQREETGRRLIDAFVRRRLIPLGAVPGGDRRRREDLHRARAAPRRLFRPRGGPGGTGYNPGGGGAGGGAAGFQHHHHRPESGPRRRAGAVLRADRAGGHAAACSILKITRDSVIKAVSHGLAPQEIVARLERHASNGVPANVLREVRDWSNWVRRVTTATLTVLQCPDRDTADRVMRP